MFSEDCVVYERTDGKLPAMEIKERPDYEFRINSNTISDTAKYGMGFSMNGGLLTTDLGNVHNLWDFFSLSDLENHKKWFSDDAAMKDDKGNKVRIGQPCFTAHGDKDVVGDGFYIIPLITEFFLRRSVRRNRAKASARPKQIAFRIRFRRLTTLRRIRLTVRSTT